jgi:hypothetical protein
MKKIKILKTGPVRLTSTVTPFYVSGCIVQ